MNFASQKQKDEWCSGDLAPILAQLVLEAMAKAKASGWVPVITSIHRSHEDDARLGGSGIHVLWRAVDIAGGTQAQHDALGREINEEWVYDPDRPVRVAVTELHGTGAHCHLQVSGKTRKRKLGCQCPLCENPELRKVR